MGRLVHGLDNPTKLLNSSPVAVVNTRDEVHVPHSQVGNHKSNKAGLMLSPASQSVKRDWDYFFFVGKLCSIFGHISSNLNPLNEGLSELWHVVQDFSFFASFTNPPAFAFALSASVFLL